MKITKENLRCPYCGEKPRLGDTSEIYGRSYGKAYICVNYPKCDSYVGAHKKTLEPKGILANAELREWKKKAHFVFDPLWQKGGYSRTKAYNLLANIMDLKKEEAHIGYFNVAMCKKLVGKMNDYFTTKNLDRLKKL